MSYFRGVGGSPAAPQHRCCYYLAVADSTPATCTVNVTLTRHALRFEIDVGHLRDAVGGQEVFDAIHARLDCCEELGTAC